MERNGKTVPPEKDTLIRKDDCLTVTGRREAVEKASNLLGSGEQTGSLFSREDWNL